MTDPVDILSGNLLAFGLRSLGNGYAGPLCDLRRASDNATMTVFPQADGSFPQPTVTAWIGASSAFVTTWYEQNGSGLDAVQATAAAQPQLIVSRASLNNTPALLFGNGSGRALSIASLPNSIFGTGGFAALIFDFATNPSISARLFAHANSIVLFGVNSGTNAVSFSQAAATTNGNWVATSALSAAGHLGYVTYSAAANANVPSVEVDGKVIATTNTQPVGAITAESGTFTVGNRPARDTPYSDAIAEAIFCTAEPSPDQLLELLANQGAYAGVSVPVASLSSRSALMGKAQGGFAASLSLFGLSRLMATLRGAITQRAVPAPISVSELQLFGVAQSESAPSVSASETQLATLTTGETA